MKSTNFDPSVNKVRRRRQLSFHGDADQSRPSSLDGSSKDSSLPAGIGRSHPDLRQITDEPSVFTRATQTASHLAEQAEHMVINAIRHGWELVHHHHLPDWMRDNDYIRKGYRPELNDVRQCFSSIFRLHTETINIWTHLLGFLAFVVLTVYSLWHPSLSSWQEKAVYGVFFAGVMLCLTFSWLFHTLYCHSHKISKLFNKLDYCGISLMILGSFVPYIYYAFHCSFWPKVIYTTLITVLSIMCIYVTTADSFSTPEYRSLRAGIFIALGLSGAIPFGHFVVVEGLSKAFFDAAFGWVVLMAVLYIAGAVIYALRVPERIWPGKFDIWFQSHQIFHVFVVAGALVHFHGINQIANFATHATRADCAVHL